jgi:hypothetical protein
MKEDVQKYILEILTRLKALLPNGNHNFQLGEDGRLWLWVAINDKFQSIIFDESYEDILPEKIIDEITESLIDAGYEFGNR